MWKESHVWQEWVCIIMPTMFSHRKCESYPYWLRDGSRRAVVGPLISYTPHSRKYKWLKLVYYPTLLRQQIHSSVQFSHSVVSYSLQPHGLQYAKLPCPSPTPRACTNSCPWSQWCHPTSHPLSSPSPPAFNLSQPQVFSSESVLPIRWPKYWSFSFSVSPSNENSGLISFIID